MSRHPQRANEALREHCSERAAAATRAEGALGGARARLAALEGARGEANAAVARADALDGALAAAAAREKELEAREKDGRDAQRRARLKEVRRSSDALARSL